MKPNFKYAIIHRHCERYPIKEMCCFFEVSRSGYYKYLKHIEHPAKDFKLAEKIRAKQETYSRSYSFAVRLISRRFRYILRRFGYISSPGRDNTSSSLKRNCSKAERCFNTAITSSKTDESWSLNSITKMRPMVSPLSKKRRWQVLPTTARLPFYSDFFFFLLPM